MIPETYQLDETDRRILLALDNDPRVPIMMLAQQLGLARGTVQTRLERLAHSGACALTLHAFVRPHWGVGSPLWSAPSWIRRGWMNRLRPCARFPRYWSVWLRPGTPTC